MNQVHCQTPILVLKLAIEPKRSKCYPGLPSIGHPAWDLPLASWHTAELLNFRCAACLVTLVPEIRLKAPTERTGKWRKHRDFTALLISWIFVFPLEAGRARKNDHVQNWEQHKVHRFLEMRCFEMLPSKVLTVACIRISTKNVFSFSSRFNCNFAVSEGPTIMHVGTRNTTLTSGMTVPVTSGTQHHSHSI